MHQPLYQTKQTIISYAAAGVIFGIYGGKICPMLDTLSLTEILGHVAVIFLGLFATRHILSSNKLFFFDGQYSKIDTLLFLIFSIPLALYYNLSYDFPFDSNLKVIFGLTVFGFLTGTILELLDKDHYIQTIQPNTGQLLSAERTSIIKQMLVLFTTVTVVLTASLIMIEVKNQYWLEHHPERVADGAGRISIIKEFIFVATVLFGYACIITLFWSRLLKRVLHAQHSALSQVSLGETQVRVPIYDYDELGHMAALTNKMLDSLQSTQAEVKATRDVAIVSLSALAETRDNETGAHIVRTQEYVKALASKMAELPRYKELLVPHYIDLLHKSAPLHDIGKVGVPDSVLLKPGKLTEEEFEIMKGHPAIGAEALSIAENQLGSSSFLRVAKEISLTHHEKWDGSGYPGKLAGDDIPIAGRLMALADVYDALISKRVYKPAFSHEKARGIIIEGKGSHFDPQVVEAFLAIESEFVQIAAQYKDKDAESTPA